MYVKLYIVEVCCTNTSTAREMLSDGVSEHQILKGGGGGGGGGHAHLCTSDMGMGVTISLSDMRLPQLHITLAVMMGSLAGDTRR